MLPVVHVRYVENPMKSSGVSSIEIAVSLVALVVCIAMFLFGVQLWHSIQ
jgi:hypothetical protein